jgi:hypothetical protein
MTEEFKAVEKNDFLTFTPGTPAHVSIEAKLIDIGGGAKKGIEYKQQVMAAAGWKYKELTSYGAYAETAADAFNRVREVLSKNTDKEGILEILKSETND